MLHLTREFNTVSELSQEFQRLAFEASQAAFKSDAVTIEQHYKKMLSGYRDLQRAVADLNTQVKRYRTPTPKDYESLETES